MNTRSTATVVRRELPLALLPLVLMVSLTSACDGDEGPRTIGLTKILNKDIINEENIGDVPTIAITKELVNCSASERAGELAGIVAEASGFAYWKGKDLGLTATPAIHMGLDRDGSSGTDEGVFMSTDEWKTVDRVSSPIFPKIADGEALELGECAAGVCAFILDGGTDRVNYLGATVQRSLVILNSSNVIATKTLPLVSQLFLKFPDATDQFGAAHTGVNDFDWTAMALNPKDGALYFINKAVRGFGGDQDNIDPVLIYKLDKSVWSNSALKNTEVKPTFVARLPIEYMVAMDVRREGEKAIDDLISILPSKEMRAKATRILKTDDLTKIKPADVEQSEDFNDTGKSLFDIWSDLWGDPAKASKNPALRVLVTDMKFDPTGELFYVQTYNGPLLIDIDLTKTFPPIGELLTFKRHRHISEAAPLLQMEAMSLIVTDAMALTGEKFRHVTMFYTTEETIPAIGSMPAYSSPDVPIMKFTCDQPL